MSELALGSGELINVWAVLLDRFKIQKQVHFQVVCSTHCGVSLSVTDVAVVRK